MGGGALAALTFTNRGVVTEEVRHLHLSLVAGACSASLAEDLIIDWDGQVQNCCNDFPKASNHGRIGEQSVAQVLAGERRAEFTRLLRERQWMKVANCATCRFDFPPHTDAVVAAAERVQAAARA